MIGQTISHYRILEKLGEGGMGVVYKAQDLKLDRIVALKFFPPHLSTSKQDKARFIQEAKAASALDHPNICTIYEIDEDEDGRLFIAMSWYEGETLREKIEKGALNVYEAISMATQVALGLQAVHSKGIIHRDIKSGNIMVTAGGHVKIMDFGLAKIAGSTHATENLAQFGTVAYMSPEQVRGEKVDQRTDLWSLGVVLYEMIAGVLPFAHHYNEAVGYAILHEDPKPLSHFRPEVPKELQRIIEKCMRRDPMSRYQNAGQLVDELLAVVAPHRGQSSMRDLYIWRKRWILLALTALILALFGVLEIWQAKEIKRNCIVLDIEMKIQPKADTLVTADMLEYLIRDELLQSTNNNVFSATEFSELYPELAPEVRIAAVVENRNVGFSIDVTVKRSDTSSWSFLGPQKKHHSYTAVDPPELLKSIIPDLRDKILQSIENQTVKASTFTAVWDAFVNMYEGEKAWSRLETPKAREYYESALRLDHGFVLAKLRLAQVLEFDGSYTTAKKMVGEIHPYLGLLSRVDSLRAVALAARLTDDLRKSISVLRDIYRLSPLRRESAFDVAEAYYAICDITNAMDFYQKTLQIDRLFAKAYNHLGYCYSHKGDHKNALDYLRKYVSLDSTANAYDSLGDGYFYAGMTDSASWAKERGIQKEPKLTFLYWAVVFVKLRQGKLIDASKAADSYSAIALASDEQARGYVFRACVNFEAGDYHAALKNLQKARSIFDSQEVSTRNHELHWLLARIGLETNNMQLVENEFREMEDLVTRDSIDETNYRMGIYKYMLHLKAARAAQRKDVAGVVEVVKKFDGPIRDKVRDHTSYPFDLAFFNTSFAEMFMTLGRLDLAEERLNHALSYNHDYAQAHYTLCKLYEKQGRKDEAQNEWTEVSRLWKDADPAYKQRYALRD
jgi:serine/threonine protein kinase/lipopolysaccharide biosynthesis regulator YciM